MTQTYSVLIERDEDGLFVAKVPDIPGCYSQASNLNDLIPRIQEAIELCLESASDRFMPLDFVGLQQVTVSV